MLEERSVSWAKEMELEVAAALLDASRRLSNGEVNTEREMVTHTPAVSGHKYTICLFIHLTIYMIHLNKLRDLPQEASGK